MCTIYWRHWLHRYQISFTKDSIDTCQHMLVNRGITVFSSNIPETTGGNVYVDLLRNPHGYFTIHSTIPAALVHNAVSTALVVSALVTSSPDMWTINIISIGSCHNPPKEGVAVWTVRPYLEIWHVYSCIWIYVDIGSTGPIHIFYQWVHGHMLDPYSYSQGKNDVSKWYPRMTPYDTYHSFSLDYFDVR